MDKEELYNFFDAEEQEDIDMGDTDIGQGTDEGDEGDTEDEDITKGEEDDDLDEEIE